ncbi:uncharacterized protein LOC112906336 [Agrilus planipennis]|uniref:Uncharacterized protein LOC112906336 n=1 Tax=Agrilus planipennis TaxID=224129 RepID=A0A7F5RJ71_AGRPL|nr:uncharacterized protein LOC112906336 [Agrilus planipennis]
MWLEESIIEQVPMSENVKSAHYLPHRPVIKNSATTKIRPVFDASSREKNQPSLNHCLEKGLNLIELIPSILLRFREQKIGIISDIRKAFLQIGVHRDDRDFLRFLWYDDSGKIIMYRHRRVVFGVCSSPFLLGATIDFHLSESLRKCDTPGILYGRQTIEKLMKSLYVDNCFTSVNNEAELEQFVRESNFLMQDAKFDLRGWGLLTHLHPLLFYLYLVYIGIRKKMSL